MEEYEKKWEEVKKAVITDGKTALTYLPLYAEYETKYGTKQCCEDVYRKLKKVEGSERDAWYLLAVMKTKQNMIETMFEYQEGLRTLFKSEFVRQSERYDKMNDEEKIIYLIASYLACQDKILLSYKYLPKLEKKYCELAAENKKDTEEWMILKDIKQCFIERGCI